VDSVSEVDAVDCRVVESVVDITSVVNDVDVIGSGISYAFTARS